MSAPGSALPGAGAGADRHHRCPLCSHTFAEADAHCGGCPMSRGCGAVACPRCGYEFVATSATLSALSRAADGVRRWLATLRRSGA